MSRLSVPSFESATGATAEIYAQIKKAIGNVRGVAVTYALLAAVVVGSAAVAQNTPNQPSPPASGSAQTTGQADNNVGQAIWQAPIGHRQPKAKDVPPGVQDNYGVRSPDDVAIDRKLRICRC
jgi:hypothetical protein